MKTLVAVDFSESTSTLLSCVKSLVREMSVTHLWLVHVVPPDPEFVGYETGPQSVRDQVAKKYRKKHAVLQHEADALQLAEVEVVPLLLQGPVAKMILKEAGELDVDLLIVGSHGHRAIYDMLVESVGEDVLRKADRPVLMIPSCV